MTLEHFVDNTNNDIVDNNNNNHVPNITSDEMENRIRQICALPQLRNYRRGRRGRRGAVYIPQTQIIDPLDVSVSVS